MTTYKDTDIESLTEDLRQVWTAETPEEKEERLRELYLKISRDDLDRISQICDNFEFNYMRTFGEEWTFD